MEECERPMGRNALTGPFTSKPEGAGADQILRKHNTCQARSYTAICTQSRTAFYVDSSNRRICSMTCHTQETDTQDITVTTITGVYPKRYRATVYIDATWW